MHNSQRRTDSKGVLALNKGLALFLTVLLLVALVLAFNISANQAFQVDEVQHVHSTFNMKDGRLLYKDFWEGHNPLLYVVLYPIIDIDDPVSSFLRSRLFVFFTFFLLNIGVTAFCAYRLSGSLAAVSAVGFLSTHTTFLERGIEVRPDNALSLLTSLSLAVQLSGMQKVQSFCVQAFLLSLAFLFTQKAVFVCFAFGCLWLLTALKEKKLKLLLYPMVIWFIPLSIALAIMYFLGIFGDYLDHNVLVQAKVVARVTEWSLSFGPLDFILYEGSRNRLWVITSLLGIYFIVRTKHSDANHMFLVWLSIVLIASLWGNPFPFPYFHVTVLPVLALCSGIFLSHTAQRLSETSEKIPPLLIIIVCMTVSLLINGQRLLDRSGFSVQDVDKPSMARQFEVLSDVQRVTEPTDRVFDLVGLYFRPDAHPVYVMTAQMVVRLKRGHFARVDETLRETEAVAIIVNYRTQWLDERDHSFIDDHFVQYNKNLYVLGTELDLRAGEVKVFEVLKEKPFVYKGNGLLLVDGMPFETGVLSKGSHRLSANREPLIGRLILLTPKSETVKPGAPRKLYPTFE